MGIVHWPHTIDQHEGDRDRIEFFSEAGTLIGRLMPGVWEIGEIDPMGARTTVDPLGGLRFRAADDELLSLVDQHGISIRDPTTGLVVTEISREAIRVADPAGGNEISMLSKSVNTLYKPRYAGGYEANPGTSLLVPTAALLGNNDLELAHAATWIRAVAQAASHTHSPVSYTEVIDTSAGDTSTLGIDLLSRGVATGASNIITSSQSNWQHAVTTHIVVKGVQSWVTPTIRSTATTTMITSATTVNLAINKPAGTVANDTLIVIVAMGNDGGSVPVGWVTPQGWQFLGATVGTTPGGAGPTQSTLAVGVWAFLADGTEGATFNTNINFGVGAKTIHATIVAVRDGEVIPGVPQMNIGGYNLVGPWRIYQPALTNITLGSGGSNAGRFLVMGKTCFANGEVTLGTGGLLLGGATFSVPFNVQGINRPLFTCALSQGASHREGLGILNNGGNTFAILVTNPAATTFVNATQPWTWAAGGIITWSGVYEIA